MLRRVIGADIELTTVLAPTIGLVRSDTTQLDQVLVNLVINARDAMPEGGKLIIETSTMVLDDLYGESRGTDVPAGLYAVLAVSDTGIGIPPELQQTIFEPFFTTKPTSTGTGLGLSTAYGIVTHHRGFIWVYSAPGRGSTFKIFFPVVDGEQPLTRSRAHVVVDLAGTETVLLVEDDDLVRRATERILRSRGYDEHAASSPDEALRLSRDIRPTLLLADLVLPTMSGRALAARLAAEAPGIISLFMSGYTDHAAVETQLLDQSAQFIQKPFSAELLLRKVREAISRTR
jgi:CheY-like chemotaxis protein